MTNPRFNQKLHEFKRNIRRKSFSTSHWIYYLKYGNSLLFQIPCCSSWCSSSSSSSVFNGCSFFVIGPHYLGVIFTILVILGGTFINLRMIVKSQFLFLHFPLTIFSYFMMFSSIFFLLITALTNPGIVLPSSSSDSSSDDEEAEREGLLHTDDDWNANDTEDEESSSGLRKKRKKK
jgi:hypothetical protein